MAWSGGLPTSIESQSQALSSCGSRSAAGKCGKGQASTRLAAEGPLRPTGGAHDLGRPETVGIQVGHAFQPDGVSWSQLSDDADEPARRGEPQRNTKNANVGAMFPLLFHISGQSLNAFHFSVINLLVNLFHLASMAPAPARRGRVRVRPQAGAHGPRRGADCRPAAGESCHRITS